MKLWIINQYASKPDTAGLTRHYEMGRRLATKGIEVLIVHGSYDLYLKTQPASDDLSQDNSVKISEFEGVQFLTVPTPPYRNNRSFGRIMNMFAFRRRAYKEMASGRHGKPDMILGSTMTLSGADAARRLAGLFSVPFVYEVRDLWPLSPIEIGGYSRHNPFIVYLGYLDRRLAKSADMIITTAPLMKEYYREKFDIPEERFLWIPNGTDIDIFSNNKPLVEKKGKGFDLFYTGSLGLANGLEHVFDQLGNIRKKLPGFRLVLVGDGPRRELLRKRAKDEGFPVEFRGAVPKKDLPGILREAEACLVYLLPSRLYRYGISLNKLADYMAAGKPVLFIGDCAENPVLRSGSGIVVEDIEGFPNALQEMIGLDHEGRVEMGNRGRAYAEENYDWDKLSIKFANALEKIVSSRQNNG